MKADVNASEDSMATQCRLRRTRDLSRPYSCCSRREADIHTQGQEASYGNTLRTASYEGHELIVQSLLEHGADVNAQGTDGRSALQIVVENGHE
jgi:hypothetical protein